MGNMLNWMGLIPGSKIVKLGVERCREDYQQRECYVGIGLDL